MAITCVPQLLSAVVLFLTSLHGFVLLPTVSTLEYEHGVEYEYAYTSTMRLTEPKAKASEVAYQVQSTVQLSPVWWNPSDPKEKLLLFKMAPRLRVKPRGEAQLSDHVSPLDTRAQLPFAVVTNDGRVSKLFAANDDEEDVLNLKRGLVSLFQLQNQDKEEVDASGKCKVHYKISGKQIRKMKSDCVYPFSKKSFDHTNKVLGVELKSSFDTLYDVAKDKPIIQSAVSKERYVLRVKSLNFASAVVHSGQKLSLVNQKEGAAKTVSGSDVSEAVEALSKDLGVKLITSEIHLTETSKTCQENCKSFADLVRDYKDALLPKNLARLKTTSAFLRLLQRVREANKQDIINVLKTAAFKKILPSLLEVVAAAQTPDSVEASIWVLPTLEDSTVVERFLLALAVSPRPSTTGVAQLKSLIEKKALKSPKAQQTAILALGSMLRSLCVLLEKCQTETSAAEAMSFLTSRLEQCSEDECRLTYLRSLRNAAWPSTIPTLMLHAAKGGKVSTFALRALHVMPPAAVSSSEVRQKLLRIFHQIGRRSDSTGRLLAADMVLRGDPSVEQVKQIVNGLSSLDETSTYLAARIKEIAANNGKLRETVNNIFKDPKLGNYNILSQPGISAAFTHLLAGDDEGNGTYGVHLELAKGGVMKHSSFDVELNNEDGHLQLMSFGLFAGGLSSFAGGSDTGATPTAEDDEGDATAGIELTVMDVSLRPYVFFVGQGELMGHVWSGTASEITPILQGNCILQDYWHQVALQSGLMLTLHVTGALSVDLSGSVQVSVWSRTAHSEIKTKTAMLIQGSASVDNSFISSAVDFSIASEPKLDFVTDTEFYESPFKMCTQMSQPSFPFRYTVRKVERIPQSKHRLRRVRRNVRKTHGRSFMLHPKNSALCDVMLKSQ